MLCGLTARWYAARCSSAVRGRRMLRCSGAASGRMQTLMRLPFLCVRAFSLAVYNLSAYQILDSYLRAKAATWSASRHAQATPEPVFRPAREHETHA